MTNPTPSHNGQRILRAKQVAKRLSVSVNVVWYRVNPKHRLHDPAFPKPFKVSENVTGWLETEIDDYIANLARQRGHGQVVPS